MLISDMVMPNYNNIEITITDNVAINSDYNQKNSNAKIPTTKEYCNIRAANILNK